MKIVQRLQTRNAVDARKFGTVPRNIKSLIGNFIKYNVQTLKKCKKSTKKTLENLNKIKTQKIN